MKSCPDILCHFAIITFSLDHYRWNYWYFRENVTMDIFVLTMISFFVALIIEGFRKKSFKIAQESAVELFKGMGQGFSQVVMLVVGGSLFTTAIQSLGVIDSLMSAVENSQSAGVLTTLIFSGATALFGILSGGGLAMFYAVIELIPNIAQKPVSMVS